jgi:flagellar basal-body rod protein FlgF
MLRGIYNSSSGMIAQQARMDTVANNLANVDKTAYKKDLTIFKAFPEMLIRRINGDGQGIIPVGSYDTMPFVGNLGTGVEVNEKFTQFKQGSLQKTANNFDVALEGKGFFVVKTEQGNRYTRNGNFTTNKEGVLMTHNGNPVLGENGTIIIKKHNFRINERGEVIINGDLDRNPRQTVDVNNEWKNPIVIDKLQVVDFEHIREIKKQGNSMYKETVHSGPPIPPKSYKIYQGFLEKSNVNIIREMVDMIEVQRSYEANQKSITTHDSMLSKLINDVGR